jgi:hypothetical protein
MSPTIAVLDELHATIGILRSEVASARAQMELDARCVSLLHDRLLRLENMMVRYLDKESRA